MYDFTHLLTVFATTYFIYYLVGTAYIPAERRNSLALLSHQHILVANWKGRATAAAIVTALYCGWSL